MLIDSVDYAVRLAATAKEIAAAAELYERMPRQRLDLASALGVLHSRLDLEWRAFITKASVELARAPQK